MPGYQGYAAVYHEYDPKDWQGPTAYYMTDSRKLLMPDESKVWDPIALWATLEYEPATMSMAFEADPYYLPPADRDYILELLSVPDGISGAPPVGTTWEVPLDELFVITVPTYRWSPDGPDDPVDPHGYLFSFTITAAPEPAGLVLFGTIMLMGLRRRAR